MNVLLVNDRPIGSEYKGGVATHIRQLRNALEERGIEISILTAQERGLPLSITPHEWRIPDLTPPPLRKRALKNHRQHVTALHTASQLLDELKPDVIHVHNLMDPATLQLLRHHGPLVKSIHDCRPFCVKPKPRTASRLIGDSEEFCDLTFGRACWKRCYAHSGETPTQRIEAWSCFYPNLKALHEIEQASQLIVYSQYLKILAIRTMPDPERIHVLNLFTEAESAATPPFDKSHEPPTFLFAGRFDPEKGILKLFDALDLIPEVTCKLILAGDGPIRHAVHQRSQASHPSHTIELKGFLDSAELYEHYRSSSVLLFPSVGSEGLGLSGIEAMYFGTPAIGFNTGGVGEWLIDGHTGILLPRNDIRGLANAMKELATHPEETEKLGRQARDCVRNKFTREAHITRLISIYRKAVECTQSNPQGGS